MENEIIKKQLDAINDLYISVRDVYISQNKDGSYSHSKSFKNNTKLTDSIIIEHLKKYKTIGVMCPEKSSKFITFDVDAEGYNEQERRAIVRGLIREIVKFGIPRHFIYLVNSGNKGYHVNIYFNGMAYLNLLYDFYEHIIYTAGYNNVLVEFRPTPTIGIKLPLSIHKKTNNESYFVDDNFCKINDNLYICNILQYDSEIFQEMAQEINLSDEERDIIRAIGNDLQPNKFKMLSKNDAEILEETGLTMKSTRNYSMVQLAILNNSRGMDKDENITLLNEWISKQNKELFSTPLSRCYIENKKIVKWVYDNNIKHSVKQNMIIKISNTEVTALGNINDDRARKVMFVLLCHSKRFDSANFYMSYNQLEFHSGISRKYINGALKYLINCGYINGVRMRRYKRTNIYNVIFVDVGSKYPIKIKYVDYDKPYISYIL